MPDEDEAAHLIAFWRARLDEDEAAAKAATPGPWNASQEDILSLSDDPHWAGACAANASGDDATHIARHVAADRKLIAAYEDAAEFFDPWIGLDHAVRIRAERFSDHPGYRQEWKP